MTSNQKNPNPNKEANSNKENEQSFVGKNMDSNSDFREELEKFEDKNKTKTGVEDNNSVKNNQITGEKIIFYTSDKKIKPSAKKGKKKNGKNRKEEKDKFYKNSAEIYLKETDYVNDDLSGDIINKKSYSNGESNKKRKENLEQSQNEIENTTTTQEFTDEAKIIDYVSLKFLKEYNFKIKKNSENFKDSKENIIEIDKYIIANIKIIKWISNSIYIETPNEIFDIPLDILYELEMKQINEKVFNKYYKNLVKYAALRGKKRYGFVLKNVMDNCSINFDKPEEIRNKKNIDLFLGSVREELELLIKIENENNDESNKKKLNLLFNENCLDGFIKYLEDNIYIGDDLRMELQGFETFENNFKDYSEKQKKNIKKCIYLFFNIKYPEYLSEKDIIKTQQTTYNHYDSRKKITNIAIEESYHTVLKNFASEKYGVRLYKPTIKYILEYNVDEYNEFKKKKTKIYLFRYTTKKK